MRLYTLSAHRMALGGAILAAALAIFLAHPQAAFAHHIDLRASETCYDFEIEADYIGGDEARYAQVRVNGVLVGTYNFSAGTEESLAFYTLAGALPADVTVEVRMYKPLPGPDHLEDLDSVTVDSDYTCLESPTATATTTTVPTATNTALPPHTATPSATDTATPPPTGTPVPSATDTPVPPTATPTESLSATDTPAPADTPTPQPTATQHDATSTPSATNTSVPTSTSRPVATSTSTPASSIAETPTYVSTVESLLPPERPGTGEGPPSETASGLPNAGRGPRGAESLLYGLLATLLAATGLGVAASGIRRAR